MSSATGSFFSLHSRGQYINLMNESPTRRVPMPLHAAPPCEGKQMNPGQRSLWFGRTVIFAWLLFGGLAPPRADEAGARPKPSAQRDAARPGDAAPTHAPETESPLPP